MIANYIFKKLKVQKDYHLDIVLNMNIQQCINGLDRIAEDAAS